jgi:hypothetical protein
LRMSKNSASCTQEHCGPGREGGEEAIRDRHQGWGRGGKAQQGWDKGGNKNAGFQARP